MGAIGRRLGLDVGDVRIGVALSDPLGVVAMPFDVIQAEGVEADAAKVAALVDEHGVICVVVGMPLNEKGEEGHQAAKTNAFVAALRKVIAVEIVTMDERFTTAIAHRTLREANVRGNRRKGLVDKIAAQQILQTYLDRAARA